MAGYFGRLASHASLNQLAVVDPISSQTSTPGRHSYAQLLLRVNVYHESLIDAAQGSERPLQGARVGLMVPPGLDFVAALLAVWSVKAIVGMTCRLPGRIMTMKRADIMLRSSDMSHSSSTGDNAHSNRFRTGLHHLSCRLQSQNKTTNRGEIVY